MTYYYARAAEGGFDEVVERVRAALQGEGFGVLTEIDVSATLKKKIDVDYPQYLILGACNPVMAHEALKMEERIGVMLPCNVVVRRDAQGTVEVAAVDPAASMAGVDNPALLAHAAAVGDKLRAAVDAVG